LGDSELEDTTCAGEILELGFELGVLDPGRRVRRVKLEARQIMSKRKTEEVDDRNIPLGIFRKGYELGRILAAG